MTLLLSDDSPKPDLHPKLLKAIHSNKDELLKGTIVCVDPSSGASERSQPAYAIFEKGKLKQVSEITVPKTLRKGISYTPHRIKYIANEFRVRFPTMIDLLVIEGIKWKINKNTDLKAYQQLNQAAGAIMAALNWRRIMQVLPWEYQSQLDETYSKSDSMDAVVIGTVVIHAAQIMQNRIDSESHTDGKL